MAKIICGVDVSSDIQHARIGRDGTSRKFDRGEEALDGFVAFCKDNRVELVVMEATGGYEKLLFARCWAAGLPAAIANPRAVRRFAEAMGFLEKTDAIDAGVIAWFAEVKAIVAQPPPDAVRQQLKAAVLRLRQLTDMRVAELNRKRLETDPDALASIGTVLALLARQIKEHEVRIAAAIDADPLWARLNAEFRTVKGVAGRTVAGILALLPEIGAVDNKAIAKLVGCAPIARDSGKVQGKRAVRGGREAVRSLLFIVAEVVRRYDPRMAEFHRRLSEKGKAKKVVRVALAHKLLNWLNAKARDVRNNFAPAA